MHHSLGLGTHALGILLAFLHRVAGPPKKPGEERERADATDANRWHNLSTPTTIPAYVQK